ncbi:MAG: RagB/SusD family nutrient uptake outer membrane protein [Bacteroidota bacterium]
MNTLFRKLFVLLLLVGVSVGCDNFLEPSVDQEKLAEDAVQTVDDLEAIVLGAHDDLNEVELYGRDFYVSADVMSDNASSNGNSGRFVTQRDWSFTTNSGYAEGVWQYFYEVIANTNLVINAPVIEEGSAREDYIRGQAYALRAFAHMNLQLAFGQDFVSGSDLGVPYVTTYAEGNLYPERNTSADVWSNIGDDFSQAATLMDPSLDAGDPVYMNYYAVKALQSRYYLYTGEFDAAIAAADDVIDNAGLSLVASADLAAAWASGSGPNSLFEAAFTSTDRLGTDNIARIYRDSNYGDVVATQDLYDAYDAADARLGLMTNTADADGDVWYRMAGKYVDELGSDNVRIIRYAEVLLNKAEALSRRNSAGDRAAALAIINNLNSTRGGPGAYTTGDPDEVIAERRLELAFEGHRLYDLARNGKDIPLTGYNRNVSGVSGTEIPSGSYLFALPIPQAEMDANSSMVQNEGWN